MSDWYVLVSWTEFTDAGLPYTLKTLAYDEDIYYPSSWPRIVKVEIRFDR